MSKIKTKKNRVFLLSLVIGLMALTTGFFAYLAYSMFGALHSKTSSSPFYSVRQSDMTFSGGNSGLKLAYPAAAGTFNGTPFYFVSAIALLLSAAVIIFTFIYFYRLIESHEITESALKSIEKNILEIPSTIMHEIKGNVNSVLINSRVLAEKIKNPEYNRDSIVKTGGAIEKETARLVQTMDNILKFTKDYTPNLEDVNLSELIEDACKTIKERVSLKEILFSVSIDKDINIKMDRDLMLQVFKNLILNAAESYEFKKGNVSIYSSYVLNRISVVTEDHGTGIEKNALKKIFEPFFTTKRTGAGLGLALAKRITEAHGFHINIESSKGSGTKISVIMEEL